MRALHLQTSKQRHKMDCILIFVIVLLYSSVWKWSQNTLHWHWQSKKSNIFVGPPDCSHIYVLFSLKSVKFCVFLHLNLNMQPKCITGNWVNNMLTVHACPLWTSVITYCLKTKVFCPLSLFSLALLRQRSKLQHVLIKNLVWSKEDHLRSGCKLNVTSVKFIKDSEIVGI